MTRIRVITPVTTPELLPEAKREFALAARPDTDVSHVLLERGPASIESEYDEAMALPDILRHVEAAQTDGSEAIIINCASDPGLDAAREISGIPVVGVAEAAFSLATVLSQRFSVIAILERDLPDLDRMFRVYGVLDRIASVRPIGIPVLSLFGDHEAAVEATTEAALAALREDGAEAITVDCTGLSGVLAEVRTRLTEAGFEVPVIDPIAAAVALAESLHAMGLSHSKRTWPLPPAKAVIKP